MKTNITRIKGLLATAGVLALLASSTPASAYILTVGGVAAPGGGLTTGIPGTTVLTFNSLTTPLTGSFSYDGVGFSGGGEVIMGSSSGQFASPSGDTTNYLLAGGPPSYAGSETLTISGQSSDYFGVYWGSMDTYNTLTFLEGNTVVATITGAQVAAGGNADGNQSLLGTNNYVNIFDLPSYDAVVLSSTSPNFEVDNIAFGKVPTVPEPGTLALLGAGLIGLGFIRRRRAV